MNLNLMNEYLKKHKTVITLNAETLEAYDEHHAKFHPKRKKRSLSWLGQTRTGLLPMLNNFLNVKTSLQRNQRKDAVQDYIQYTMRQQGIKQDMIAKCAVVVKQYNPTHRKFDLDGVSVKSAFDAMTKHEFWQDDNYDVVQPLIFIGGCDKENPRSEICIYEITEEYPRDFVIEVIMNELVKK